MSNNQLIEIDIGMPIKKMVSESPVKFSQDCLPQASFCFYEIKKSYNDKNLPSVTVNKTLKVDRVAGVTVAVNQDLGETVENLRLAVKSLPSNSRHEEYRTFIYKLISQLKEAGWTHHYARSDPRISGAQFYQIASPDKLFGKPMLRKYWLDPDYAMSIDQWLQTDDFYTWNFYKEGNYLELNAWRRKSEAEPKEKGTYLISLEFKSEVARWRYEFKTEEDKNRWKQLLPARLEFYGQERKKLEDRARAAGIEIDTAYQDPPIMALKFR